MALEILSLGGGVQSTTMALMAAQRELTPMPTAAIFADTQAEPSAVYAHLAWLAPRLPFPIAQVTAGSLETALLKGATSQRVDSAPFYVTSERTHGGMLRRQCTSKYKIEPIVKKCRELLGTTPRQRITGVAVRMWIGISLDEIQRMKTNRTPWIENCWPLVDRRMTRGDCVAWLTRHRYPIPTKSACYFCPYHDNAFWRTHKRANTPEWQKAVRMDEAIRHGLPGVKQTAYLHRSLTPLADVDVSTPEDRGQLNFFLNECEGLCGV